MHWGGTSSEGGAGACDQHELDNGAELGAPTVAMRVELLISWI